MNFWNEPINFFARQSAQIERLAPIYLALCDSMRGAFFVPAKMVDEAARFGVIAVGLKGSVNQPLEVIPTSGTSPMVTCAYRDLLLSVRSGYQRAQIHLQADEFKAAASDRVSVFLCPDQARADWVKRNWPKKDHLLMGESAQSTAEAIRSYVSQKGNMRSVTHIDGESIGILYVAFGPKAAQAVKVSASSLRRVGLEIPVCVVGDTPVDGFQFIEWKLENPFDGKQKPNFQFRAGRVKPWLVDLTPFDRTLYLDADTEFMGDIVPGFEVLGQYDVAIARENLTLHQLYNKALAGWEINIKERDATIRELGAGPNVYFLNSGVIFFRKSAATETAMHRWYESWMEWQQWDEQLAFMRAFHRTPEARVKVLDPSWNFPHRRNNIVIFHNYGRGVVRMNVTPEANVPVREAA